jgi:hypothetical protein
MCWIWERIKNSKNHAVFPIAFFGYPFPDGSPSYNLQRNISTPER